MKEREKEKKGCSVQATKDVSMVATEIGSTTTTTIMSFP
jgi:hypothetical protein